MNMDLFIVSCPKHVEYLKYALKSIAKFASGFHAVKLAFPRNGLDVLYYTVKTENLRQVDVIPFEEWPGKGMLHHMYLEMIAWELCPFADLIKHFDSDWVFTDHVTPEHFMVDGKPKMVYASFDWLVKQQANLINWKIAAEKALGFEVPNETMRCTTLVYPPAVYRKARELIELHTGKPMDQYIKEQKNEFPQTFAEYSTLGAVAWEFFRDKFHWINQETDPFPDTKTRQAWSHRPPTPEDMTVFSGLGLL